MIGQTKGETEQKEGRERRRRKWKKERMQKKKKSRAEAQAQGLEKPQVLRGLIDVEGGSVAVDLPNLGTQHVFILIVCVFIARAYLGWRFTTTALIGIFIKKQRGIFLFWSQVLCKL